MVSILVLALKTMLRAPGLGRMATRTIPSADAGKELKIPMHHALNVYSDAEIAEAAQSLGSSWDETLQAATVEAEQQHVGVNKTQAEVIIQMMDRWKAGNANGERV